MGSDARGAESTEIIKFNHEHRKDIINENKATNNATRINESRTVISTFFKNLKERGYGLIPYIFKEDHEIRGKHVSTKGIKFSVEEISKDSCGMIFVLPFL